MKEVEIKKKRRLFDDFFKIDEIYLKHELFSGGMSKEMRRLSFERGDSVGALVRNRDTGNLILINQFRYPTYTNGPGWTWEVVAGILHENENAEEAMKREILEEIGYKVETLTYITMFYVSPGGTSERVFLYYAEVTNDDKISEGGGLETEHEDILVQEHPWQDIEKMLASGEIVDAKTLIALMWFRDKIK